MATASSSAAYRPLSSRPTARPHHASRSSITHTPFTTSTPTFDSIGSGSSAAGAGSSYRHEEDAVIFELGARYLRAGFQGESTPMCVLRYSPEDGRRVGDYRGWTQPTRRTGKKVKGAGSLDEWCKGYELWNADMRNCDMRLFQDRLEKTIRGVYNKYLLTDAGSSKIVLVLPSIVSHPVLSAVLSTIFNRWKHPSITLLPSPTMSTVAAGLRSALVVDIGWEESTVTAVYEYREIKARRSTRATRLLMHRFAIVLSRLESEHAATSSAGPEETTQADDGMEHITVDFDTCEEVMNRLSWCRRKLSRSYRPRTLSLHGGASSDDGKAPFRPDPFPVTIPLPSGASPTIPYGDIADLVEETIFVDGVDPRDLDDEEMPLDYLVYRTLLDLSPDVRGMLMARIVFTGGGSEIVGIRQRSIDGVERLIERYGWSPVRGMVIDRMKAEGQLHRRDTTAKPLSIQQQRQPPNEQSPPLQPDLDAAGTTGDQSERRCDSPQEPVMAPVPATTPPLKPQAASAPSPTPLSPHEVPPIPAHAQSVPPNPIDTKLARQQAQSNPAPAPVVGTLRYLTTMGPWAGASLTTSLNIRGVVEIERERFLKDGISGWGGSARREAGEHGHGQGHGHEHERGHDNAKERRRSGFMGRKDRDSVIGRDRGSWTLGGWA